MAFHFLSAVHRRSPSRRTADVSLPPFARIEEQAHFLDRDVLLGVAAKTLGTEALPPTGSNLPEPNSPLSRVPSPRFPRWVRFVLQVRHCWRRSCLRRHHYRAPQRSRTRPVSDQATVPRPHKKGRL